MNDDFTPFELAVKLKEKGFRELCLLHYESYSGFYSNSIDTYDRPNQELDYSDFLKCFNEGNSIGLIDAPTISQVLKWLRNEKKIYCLPYFEQGIDMWLYAICKPAYGCEFPEFISESIYDSYEQAAVAGVNYCLENLI